MHTFAPAISRHRCHGGSSQEPEEQHASKHSQSCQERLRVQLQGELSCSVRQQWSTAQQAPHSLSRQQLALSSSANTQTHSRNNLQHSTRVMLLR